MKTKIICIALTAVLLCSAFTFISYGVRENDIDCFLVLLKDEYLSQAEDFEKTLEIDEIVNITKIPVLSENDSEGIMYEIKTRDSSEEAAGKVYSMLISDERVKSVTPDYIDAVNMVKEEKELQTVSCLFPFDVNGDGNVSAADARKALRASVGLEELSMPSLKAIGVTEEKDITAAVARNILRAAVGLEDAPRFIVSTENEDEKIIVGPLECNGSAGYSWVLTGETEKLTVEEKSYGAYSLDIGGTVNYYYILTPKDKGVFKLTLTYKDHKTSGTVSAVNLEIRHQVHVCELPGPEDDIWKS